MGEPLEFYRSLNQLETDDCIIWPYSKSTGYGVLNIKGKVSRVHALVCSDNHGLRPSKLHQAGHLCGNRACVNYRHIRWITQSQNEKDKISHNLSNHGERNGQSKLTSNDVIEIRKMAKNGISVKALAMKYGVANVTIYDIIAYRRWSHLKGD